MMMLRTTLDAPHLSYCPEVGTRRWRVEGALGYIIDCSHIVWAPKPLVALTLEVDARRLQAFIRLRLLGASESPQPLEFELFRDIPPEMTFVVPYDYAKELPSVEEKLERLASNLMHGHLYPHAEDRPSWLQILLM